MKRRDFLLTTAGATAALALPTIPLAGCARDTPKRKIEPLDVPDGAPKILIAGGGFDTAFIAYMAGLTGKERPRLCYLPTAAADRGIQRWHDRCAPLDVESHHQESFISSYRMDQGWDEVFLSMDGIVVSGGNTLNQQAIWRAQGIDEVLREAWNRGIVLGGASAGSLCWFEEGTTDSRPKELTKIECLGFLEGSHSPHYDGEAERRPTYHRLIASGDLKPGWACDNNAGIYFEGTEPMEFVATREDAGVYYVDLVDGEVVETPFETTLIA